MSDIGGNLSLCNMYLGKVQGFMALYSYKSSFALSLEYLPSKGCITEKVVLL